MLELIAQHRYRLNGLPVDIGPYHNHGRRFGTSSTPGVTPDTTAITFPVSSSQVVIDAGQQKQWTPLGALRIEVVTKVDPGAALTLTLLDAPESFRFEISQLGLAATIAGGAGGYLRSDAPWSPDGQFHQVPVNRWVTLGFDHDGFSRMRVLIDGQVVGQTSVTSGVPSAPAGVCVGNGFSGGRPLLGAIDELRIWRHYPRGVEDEFLCRPFTAEMASCWEQMFRAVNDWAKSYPGEAQTFVVIVTGHLRSWIRSLYLLPESEQTQVRSLLRELRKLWCQGRIDGAEMEDVIRRLTDAFRHNGLDPDMATVKHALTGVIDRLHLDKKVFALDCDPKILAFLKLLDQGGARS